MARNRRDPRIAAHIESVSTRGEADTARLTSELFGSCWPGDSGDRTEPAALEWVRRWGPTGLRPIPLPCSCAIGNCRLCN